jgi:alkaline phosphatase D
MSRLRIYIKLVLLLASGLGLSLDHAQAQDIELIAFGSCSHQDKPQPIWSAVLEADPDLFIFLGDNIYGDSDDPAVLQSKYRQLAGKPGFQQLRAQTDIVATWDDHDYGRNDAGAEYGAKEASRQMMLDFFAEPMNSERRIRPDGIYTSYLYGSSGRVVQVILLDLRWNRGALVEVADPMRRQQREQENRGPYEVNLDTEADLLGDAQWRWIEQQLQVEADVHIIGSSIQLLAEFTGWESWANFPRARQRFIELLARYQREPVVIISGDVHWAELSEIHETANNWPLIELTSSGLTEEWKAISPNRHRVGEAFAVANFGLIEIDWSTETPALSLKILSVDGVELIHKKLTF